MSIPHPWIFSFHTVLKVHFSINISQTTADVASDMYGQGNVLLFFFSLSLQWFAGVHQRSTILACLCSHFTSSSSSFSTSPRVPHGCLAPHAASLVSWTATFHFSPPPPEVESSILIHLTASSVLSLHFFLFFLIWAFSSTNRFLKKVKGLQ